MSPKIPKNICFQIKVEGNLFEKRLFLQTTCFQVSVLKPRKN